MNWDQKQILSAMPEPGATWPSRPGEQVAMVAKELGELATHFRLARDLVDPGLTGLEVTLAGAGFLAGVHVQAGNWDEATTYDPARAMEKAVDTYIALVGLVHQLGVTMGLGEVDLDAMAVARVHLSSPDRN